MSSFLKKFVETSIYAATALFAAKLAGVGIGLLLSKASFTLATQDNGIISAVVVPSLDQVRAISLIADLVFTSGLIVTALIVLTKTILFNDLTTHPRVLVKVIHYNLSHWLEDGTDMYPKLFAWGLFLWLGVVLIAKDYTDGLIPLYTPFILGLFAVFYTYQVFTYLDTHISDMISYIHGNKTRNG